MNLTLVAYYGSKDDEEIRRLIETAQGILGDVLETAFDSYDIRQVHGTIVGLEGTKVGDLVINTNFIRRRQSLKAINLQHVLEITDSMLQFDIRIGSFKDGAAYPFTSRGLHPYLRSFSIQGEIAVSGGKRNIQPENLFVARSEHPQMRSGFRGLVPHLRMLHSSFSQSCRWVLRSLSSDANGAFEIRSGI